MTILLEKAILYRALILAINNWFKVKIWLELWIVFLQTEVESNELHLLALL